MEQQELCLVRTYFVRGAVPKGWQFKPAIKKPPTSGFGLAVLLKNKKGYTLFYPFTVEAYTIPENCGEVQWAKELVDLVDIDYGDIARVTLRNWERFSGLGLQRDYGIAATVLKTLGAEIPAGRTPGTLKAGESSGGKPAADETIPLETGTKRSQVAEFFQKSAMIQQAMQELGLTRSGVMSHLRSINKNNGFGYKLTGDSAELLIPDGACLFQGGE